MTLLLLNKIVIRVIAIGLNFIKLIDNWQIDIKPIDIRLIVIKLIVIRLINIW